MAFLIVEGPSDGRFFDHWVDRGSCQILPASGKGNVIEAVGLLNAWDVPGVLGVVDRDFDDILGSLNTTANVVVMDARDLEMMLIGSRSFGKAILELGSQEKVANLERERGSSVKEIILELARPLGCIRLVSAREGLNLDFDGWNLESFIDRRELIVDSNALIGHVLGRSGDWSIRSDVESMMEECLKAGLEDCDVCCGHDVVEILGLALRKRIGSLNAEGTEAKVLERQLRTGFELEELVSLGLFREICDWEVRNEPFGLGFTKLQTPSSY